jgi:hypothetical protein
VLSVTSPKHTKSESEVRLGRSAPGYEAKEAHPTEPARARVQALAQASDVLFEPVAYVAKLLLGAKSRFAGRS